MTAALGALVLGEYELAGATPLAAGVLFGLVVAEVGLSTAGRRRGRGPALAAPAAGASAAGMVWAAWISSGRDWSYVPGAVWVGAVLAAGAAILWIRGPTRRAPGTPPAP